MMPAAQRPPAGDQSLLAAAGTYAPPSPDRFGALAAPATSDCFPAGAGSTSTDIRHAPSSWKPCNGDEDVSGPPNATFEEQITPRRRQQVRTSTQSDVIKRPEPENVPPVPALTVTGPSSSTSAMALEAPRPIMRHRSSKVRFSSPLRQELKKLGDDDDKTSPAVEYRKEPELGLTARPKRSTSLVNRSRSTKSRGGGKVIWAKSVHGAPGSSQPGPSTANGRPPSAQGASVRRARSTGSIASPPSEVPGRGPSQRTTGPRRQPSARKPPPGLWGDLPPSGTTPVRTPSMGRTAHRPAPVVNDEPGGVDMSHAPKFSRSGLKRASVVLPTPKGTRPPTIATPSRADMDQIRDMNLNSPREGRPPLCGPSRIGRSPPTRLTGLVRKLSKRGGSAPGAARSKSTGARGVVISGPVLQDITHMDVPGRPGFKVSLQHTTRGLQLQPVEQAAAAPSSFRPLSTTPTPRTPLTTTPTPRTPRMSPTPPPMADHLRSHSTTPTPRTAPTPPPLADTGFSGFQPLRAGPDEDGHPLTSTSTPRRQPVLQMPVPVPTPPKPAVPAINVINSASPSDVQLRAGRVPVHTVPAPVPAPVQRARPSSHLSTVSGVSGVSRRVSIHDMNEFGVLAPTASSVSLMPPMPPSPSPSSSRPGTFYAPGRMSAPALAPAAPEPEWDDPGLLPTLPPRGSSLLARSVPGSPALKHVDDRAEARRRSLSGSLSGSPRTAAPASPTQGRFASLPSPTQGRFAGLPSPAMARHSMPPSPTYLAAAAAAAASPQPQPQPRYAGTPPAPVGFSSARSSSSSSSFQTRPRSSLSARRSLTATVPAMLALDEVDEPPGPGPESSPLPHTHARAGAPHLPPLPQVGPLSVPFSRTGGPAAAPGPGPGPGLPAGSHSHARTSWQQQRRHQASASVGTLYDAHQSRSRTSVRSSARSRASFSFTAHSGMTAESFFTDEASTASTAHPLSTPDLLLADIADGADGTGAGGTGTGLGVGVGLPDLPASMPQSWSLPQMARLSLNPGPPTEPLPDLPPRFERERAERGDSGRSSEGEDESTPSLSNDHSQSGQSEEPFGVPLTPPPFTPTPLAPEKEVLAEPARASGASEPASASAGACAGTGPGEHGPAPWPDKPAHAPSVPRAPSRAPVAVAGYASTGRAAAAGAARATPSGLELPVRRKVTIVRRGGAEKISSFPLSTPLVLGDGPQPALAHRTQRHRQDDEWSLASLASLATHDTHGTGTHYTHSADSHSHAHDGTFSSSTHGTFSSSTHGTFSSSTHGTFSSGTHASHTSHTTCDRGERDLGLGFGFGAGADDADVDAAPPAPAFRRRHAPQSSITSAMSVSSAGHEAAIVEVTRAKTAMAMELRL